MKKITLLTLLVCAAVAVHAQTTVITSADARIDGGSPTSNFGSSSGPDELFVRDGGGNANNHEKSYLQFDVGGVLAAGESFDNASFVLSTRPNQSVSSLDITITIWGIVDNNDSWTETGITWNNAPANDTTSGSDVLDNASFDTVELATLTANLQPDTSYSFTDARLTEYLNWTAGAIADPYGNGASSDTVATIIVTSTGGNQALGRFWAREDTGVSQPRLDLAVIPEPATAGLALGGIALLGLLVLRRRR